MVMPEGRSRLPALSRFAASFANAFAKHEPNSEVLADVAWWHERLQGAFCGMPIREIPPPIGMRIFVDASTSFGIGIVIDDEWDHWVLIPGWQCESRDIGWAEMVAVELGLRAAIELGVCGAHLVIRGDNQGVVGAMDAGKSRNPESNRVLQRIVSSMLKFDIWLTMDWVASEDNVADAPSRGLPAGALPRRMFSFNLPFALRDFVEHVKL